jgi:hypothetical protein
MILLMKCGNRKLTPIYKKELGLNIILFED